MDLETIIGLEIHIELKTKTKLFCSCPVSYDETRPNLNICPVCLGHPGVLPVLNKEAVKKILLFGLALNSKIPETSCFDRKNYFYPDLPKGYQISQFPLPLVIGGHLEIEINNQKKKIRLERMHLEEDAAKLVHSGENKSFVDFNRSGIPLIEIVTKPEISSPDEAKVFLETLRLVVKYLDISDAEMQKGQMRCDANISLRPTEEKKYFPKTEVKNLNSFRAVEEALEYEKKRQTKLWEQGTPPKTNSTCGWDEKKKITLIQREKEESHDYRYFPEPDLVPLELKSMPFSLDQLRTLVKELPLAKKDRFMKMYHGLSSKEAEILVSNELLANFTEKVISELKAWCISLKTTKELKEDFWEKNKRKLIKITTNWLINRLWPLIQQEGNKAFKRISPENFAEFIILIFQNKFSSTLGQKILEEMVRTGADPDRIIEKNKLEIINNQQELEKIVRKIIQNNPKVVDDFKKGKENAVQFLIGQVMKQTKGSADPKLVHEILKKTL